MQEEKVSVRELNRRRFEKLWGKKGKGKGAKWAVVMILKNNHTYLRGG